MHVTKQLVTSYFLKVTTPTPSCYFCSNNIIVLIMIIITVFDHYHSIIITVITLEVIYFVMRYPQLWYYLYQ